MRNLVNTMKRLASGGPDTVQGVVHGHPVTFNPDDGMFYVHAPGTTDGTNVLGRIRDWRNAVQFARRKAAPAANPDRCPACGAEYTGQPVLDPDGRRVCGGCGGGA